MKELVSIIIPIYNVERDLKRCIESVLNQTYKNIEIILVDDGSPDNCPKICEDYKSQDSRIKVIHKKNGGLSDARNAGIEISQGKYITFIDSDDYVTEDYVEYLYKLIVKYKADMSICSHDAVYINDIKRFNTDCNESIMNSDIALEKMLYHKNYDVSAWAKMYKMELFNEIRYPVGRLFEDAATTYKLIDKSQRIAYGSGSKYKYIIRPDSIVTSKFNYSKLDLIISTNEMCDFIEGKYYSLQQASIRRRVYANLSTLRLMDNVAEEYKAQKEEIIKTIKKYSFQVLKDKKTPKRDKIAILAININSNMFYALWRVYEKISGRKY